ncbi:MAG: STAS domain-containing protein [Desulfobacterales bacterium]|nr:STAS domain-containing protein [Desulfobacterales bacterium]MBF0397246.1 STAS domain-containing protein [Desulfobacterales bacterium]
MKALVNNQTLFIYPETDLVASRIESLRDFILGQLRQYKEPSRIVLDASGIEIVDSLGVNLIIGLYRQADSESKKFEIVAAGNQFMKVANFFRFSTLFSVKSKEEKGD